jgi:hypothetical protein
MTPPPCDKHKNLQMVRLQTDQTFVHVCPVPSCGRRHDNQGYFEVVDGQIVRGEIPAPNRIFAARNTIMKIIRARVGV